MLVLQKKHSLAMANQKQKPTSLNARPIFKSRVAILQTKRSHSANQEEPFCKSRAAILQTKRSHSAIGERSSHLVFKKT